MILRLKNFLQTHALLWLSLLPFLWLIVFFFIPFLFIGKISVAETVLAQPPFTALFTPGENGPPNVNIQWSNYGLLFSDALYMDAYLNSVKVAALCTLLCVLIGFPLAYVITQLTPRWRTLGMFLIILPFWTSFLIRVYAWIGILKDNGLLNNLLLSLGVVDSPLPLLYTDLAVYIGIVYSYLPFMVLPIYAALLRVDKDLIAAAADLGSHPSRTLISIVIPLAMPGIAAGSLLVFIPAVGEFVIPDLLGGPQSLMVGKILWTEFFNNHDWPVAAAMAMVMVLVLVVPIAILQRLEHAEVK